MNIQLKNKNNELTELGYKIFLDRYALKDLTKQTISKNDLVIVCTDLQTGQREIGKVVEIEQQNLKIKLTDGTHIWRSLEHVDKPIELSPEETMDRVARGVAAVEDLPTIWQSNFRWLLDEWKFIPGGRILTAAGSEQKLSLYNCYVLPSPKDSREGIIQILKEQTEIMSRGGGVGINLSTLRPRHAYVKGVNGRSSGAVSWGALYSFATGLIEQGGSRRGALMLMLDVWHPDILEFINAKRKIGYLTNANISVAISDAFMEAVKNNDNWDLIFPDTSHPDYKVFWNGNIEEWQKKQRPIIVYKTIPAREIWEQIIYSAWESAEPGIWFKDRTNKLSNSWYYAPLIACNPCGEEPLPAYGVCNLGSLNLPRFLKKNNKQEYVLDWETLKRAIHYAVRFLDNVIDINYYFMEQHYEQQQQERRIGLGTLGLAELLIKLKLRYGSDASIQFIDKLYKFIAIEAYTASIELAKEKGSFPAYHSDKYLQSGFLQQMPDQIRQNICEFGIRNVTLLTQPPTGTTGTMVNTSTGIEPFFYWEYDRKSRLGIHTERVTVYQEWLEQQNLQSSTVELPDYFVTAMELTPEEHIKVLATVQRWIDASISKTANLPADYTVKQTKALYEKMYELGCKGGTVYRDQSRNEQILNLKKESKVRPRQYKRYGVTYSKKTPAGTVHITMNDDDNEQPFEVFVDLGKAGSDIKAMAEALGRLISLILRIPSTLTPLERIEEVVNQLKGIGGSQSHGFGPNRILSLPDVVGNVLEEHYLSTNTYKSQHPKIKKSQTENNALNIKNNKNRGTYTDLCPSCGQMAFIRTNGCANCISCGYSLC